MAHRRHTPIILVRMKVLGELYGSKHKPANNRELRYSREILDFLTGEETAPGSHFTSITFTEVDRDDHALSVRIMTTLQRVAVEAIDRFRLLQFVEMLNRSKQAHQAEDRKNGLLPPLDEDGAVFN